MIKSMNLLVKVTDIFPTYTKKINTPNTKAKFDLTIEASLPVPKNVRPINTEEKI